MERGYLSFVLHAHLPFVRHPEHEEFLEEDWLYEAITETYIPLADMMADLEAEGVRFRLVMSMSPPLCEMLADDLLQKRYIRYLDNRINGDIAGTTDTLGNGADIAAGADGNAVSDFNKGRRFVRIRGYFDPTADHANGRRPIGSDIDRELGPANADGRDRGLDRYPVFRHQTGRVVERALGELENRAPGARTGVVIHFIDNKAGVGTQGQMGLIDELDDHPTAADGFQELIPDHIVTGELRRFGTLGRRAVGVERNLLDGADHGGMDREGDNLQAKSCHQNGDHSRSADSFHASSHPG